MMGPFPSQHPAALSGVVSFAQILEARAERQPHDEAFSFTTDGDSVAQSLSYLALYQAARHIAARLQQQNLAGERIVLCFPPGLDFVAALYGCFLARSIAVPAPYQPGRAARARLASILRDAMPAAVLSTAAGIAGQASRPGDQVTPSPEWIAVDVDDAGLTPDDYRSETFREDSVAILQYTSGSTADPKGVVLRQSTLLANSAVMAPNFDSKPDTRSFSWLPTFHDFGLVGGVLQPLFIGYPSIMMAPTGFLRRPLSWLRAIWSFRATLSGGPSFAYDLCVERFPGGAFGEDLPAELRGVDLRDWRVAVSGAEPVRSETMERFARTFAPLGFRYEAFTPCYGLAESTLFVAGGHAQEGPAVLYLDSEKLRDQVIDEVAADWPSARTLVGCRRTGEHHVVVPVDPTTNLPLPDLRIGEIWVAGPSVADSYWNRPDETRETFQATLADYPGRRFLRTGDLGFLKEGMLFVVGRNRDLIVVRGQNHFFADLERTVAVSHPEVSLHGAVAFSVEADGQERLVLVAELRQPRRRRSAGLDRQALVDEIRRAVREAHGIDPLAILLVEPMSLPRTSSGKIQRARCKLQYLESTLELALERSGETPGPDGSPAVAPTSHDVAASSEGPASRAPDAAMPICAAPVAIVGAHCRLPGARGLDELWRLLRDRGDAITEVPPNRWKVDDYYDPRPGAPGKMATREGGFLADVDRFDAQFFGLPPREAALIDPQQRLLLEVAWETLEMAGQDPGVLAGSQTGVFVGIGNFDFAQEFARRTTYDQTDAYLGTGMAHCIAANRLSYFLDLRGPSLAVDTACSSSLVAVHLACESLRRGECTLALAAGVNVILEPTATLAFSQARMLSPDGRCKTFDAEANGYVRSEGCGVVILKLLDDALRDGNPILGIVRGSAVNQDGRTSGITVPNGLAQQAVIRAALAQAGLRPGQLGFVEAHGTATALGDLTELQALAEVFRGETTDRRPCVVGSIKANLGHLETAAGIAGLIKVLLCFRHGEIPPQINLQRINPHVDLRGVPLEIATERKTWVADGQPRFAGVSSFGFGGTNAHVVLQEPPKPEVRRPAQPTAPPEESLGYLLPLSAKTHEALRDLARRYMEQLARPDGPDVADVCFTAGVGRAHFPHQCVISGLTGQDIRDGLMRFVAGAPADGVHSGHRAPGDPLQVAFLFTGQGSQYAGMARGLYQHSSVFRQALDACDKVLQPLLSRPLLNVLYDSDCASLLDETEFTQPALFAIEYALAHLLCQWGIQPAALLGHSVGDYVAACLAGVFTLEDGLGLIALRARLMQAMPRDGLMAAVFADGSAVDKLIRGAGNDVAVAARNAPQNTVISGRRESMEAVLEEARRRGWKTVRLTVSHAFHSPLMAEVAEPFRAAARLVHFRSPTLPLISNLTGNPWLAGDIPDVDYWTRHLLEPVRFADGVRSLRKAGIGLFVEVGPHPTLTALGKRCLLPGEGSWVHCLARNQDDRDVLRSALARAYCAGLDVDWTAFYAESGARRASVPTYPFQRERYWFDDRLPAASAGLNGATTPLPFGADGHGPAPYNLLGRRDLTAAVPTYAVYLHAPSLAFLEDHQIDGRAILPASAYVEMGLALADDLKFGNAALRDVRFLRIKELGDESPPLWTVGLPTADGELLFQVRGAGDTDGILYASGVIVRSQGTMGSGRAVSIAEIQARCPDGVGGEELYAQLAERGLDYRGCFRRVRRVWRGPGEAIGEIRCDLDANLASFQLHPALLDACLHVVLGALPTADLAGPSDSVLVPVGVESLRVFRRATNVVWSHVCLDQELHLGNQVGCDVRLFGENGELHVELRGLHLQRLPRRPARDAVVGPLFDITWVPQALPTGPEPSCDGDWLLVAEDSDGSAAAARLVRAVADAIEKRGGHCIITGDGSLPIERPASPRAVLFFAGVTSADPTDSRDCRRLLALAQRLLAQPRRQVTPLSIITLGSQPPAASDAWESRQPGGLNQSLLWGFGRTLAREDPNRRYTLVDVARATFAEAVPALVRECAAASSEEQVVLRGTERWVARLIPARADDSPPLSASVDRPEFERDRSIRRLVIPRPGSLDGVTFRNVRLEPPAAGEVEIEVAVAALNFRDVMKTLGIYPLNPGMPFWLGDECCGVVTACGAGVSEFKPGDPVIAVAPASFSSRVHAPAHLVIHRPPGLSTEEAATIPIAFSTAYYALLDVARLSRGDSVLIHGGAGGVGLAAIQIAREAGATVFATAGSPEKREYLRSLGVAAAFDSRTLDFADEVRERTGGQGVDVVLNSLSGEALLKSIEALRPFGRFVEIGKRDIFENAKIGLRSFQRNLSFFAVDMERFFAERPERARTLLHELAARFKDGRFRALPLTSFSIDEASRAFHYMAQRKNIGKVVLSMDGRARPTAESESRDVYLITGGLGGLGLEVATWLVSQGARRLVLVSRREPEPEQAAALAELRQSGVSVETVAADVGDRVSLSRILDELDARGLRLSRVYHAAGVLDDAHIQQLDEGRLEQVLRPKVHGAWNLHELTRDRPLDQFVLFSSVASVLGSPGQANYAAANAFLDALSHYRRRLGLPGISINWGPWKDVGMTRRAGLNARFADLGLRPFSIAEGLNLFARIQAANPPQVVAVATDWHRRLGLSSDDRVPSLLRSLVESLGTATTGAGRGIRPELLAILAIPETERLAALVQLLSEQFASVTGLPIDRLESAKPLFGYGLDSLMGLELLLRIEERLGIKLPTESLSEDITLASLAADVLPRLAKRETGASREPASVAQTAR